MGRFIPGWEKRLTATWLREKAMKLRVYAKKCDESQRSGVFGEQIYRVATAYRRAAAVLDEEANKFIAELISCGMQGEVEGDDL